MTSKNELPENIRQAIALIAAVIRRIKKKELDKPTHKSLYNHHPERRLV